MDPRRPALVDTATMETVLDATRAVGPWMPLTVLGTAAIAVCRQEIRSLASRLTNVKLGTGGIEVTFDNLLPKISSDVKQASAAAQHPNSDEPRLQDLVRELHVSLDQARLHADDQPSEAVAQAGGALRAAIEGASRVAQISPTRRSSRLVALAEHGLDSRLVEAALGLTWLEVRAVTQGKPPTPAQAHVYIDVADQIANAVVAYARQRRPELP